MVGNASLKRWIKKKNEQKREEFKKRVKSFVLREYSIVIESFARGSYSI